jgi:hypothetical protein
VNKQLATLEKEIGAENKKKSWWIFFWKEPLIFHLFEKLEVSIFFFSRC